MELMGVGKTFITRLSDTGYYSGRLRPRPLSRGEWASEFCFGY